MSAMTTSTSCRVCDCAVYRHVDAHGKYLDGCECGHIDIAHNGDLETGRAAAVVRVGEEPR